MLPCSKCAFLFGSGTFSLWCHPKFEDRCQSVVEFIKRAIMHSKNGKFLYFLRSRVPGKCVCTCVCLCLYWSWLRQLLDTLLWHLLIKILNDQQFFLAFVGKKYPANCKVILKYPAGIGQTALISRINYSKQQLSRWNWIVKVLQSAWRSGVSCCWIYSIIPIHAFPLDIFNWWLK